MGFEYINKTVDDLFDEYRKMREKQEEHRKFITELEWRKGGLLDGMKIFYTNVLKQNRFSWQRQQFQKLAEQEPEVGEYFRFIFNKQGKKK